MARDVMNIIKNIYDEETLDAIKSFDQNVLALMHHNPIFKNVEIDLYTRIPLQTGNNQSQIQVNVSKQTVKEVIFLSEDFMTQINEGEEIRSKLIAGMNKIKVALKL